MHSHLESPSSSKMKRLNSEKCLGECAEKKKYPISAQDYELIEEIGQGVSASVHRALCIPFNEVVAIKILDFERSNSDLSNICREAQTMILVDHPNVLKAHCSFVNDHSLWVVMPYMAGGSCLHILKAAYPDGFEEVIIATVLREVLRGLEYLHHHGHIHRDVKAGNILVDLRGAIKLGDFGVSACLFDSGDRQRSRNTFVGTPCWMAPEVMEQLHGYDFKADIWSFGITALELAHGHAPFSKYPPMKVLLMTLQNAPPGLDYERDKKFSKSFKQMIAMCLVKDPSKRPSAQKLLKHTFFKQARSSDYIARKILEGLPSLGDRLKALKLKEADMLAQKKMPDGEKEEISQNEYKRGLSGWNFNIEDVKTQASLIQDIDDADKDQGCCSNSFLRMDSMQERQSQWVPSNMTNSLREKEDDDVMKNKASPLPLSERSLNHTNGSEDENSAGGSTCEQDILQNGFLSHDNVNKIDLNESGGPGTYEKHLDCTTTRSFHESGVSMGPDATDNCVSPLKGESEKHQNQLQNIGNCSVPVVSLVVDDTSSENLPKVSKLAASNGDESDEKGKVPVVQQKGRFKVTSESVGLEKSLPTPLLQKSHSMQVITQHPSISLPSSPGDATMNQGSSLFSQLHYILQTNIIQRDNILNLMKQLSTGDISANNTSNGGCIQIPATITEKSLLEAAHEREKELIQDINDLQLRLLCAQEELQRLKTKNAQV